MISSIFLSNLETVDYVIIVIVVFVFIFLFCLSSCLIKKNRELRNKLNDIDKSLDKVKNTNSDLCNDDTLNASDSSTLENVTNDIDNTILNDDIKLDDEFDNLTCEENFVKDDINEILKDMPNLNETKPYTKNVLRSFNTSGQTSPVNIGKVTVDAPKLRVSSNFSHDIGSSNLDKQHKEYSDIEEISRRLEEQVKPQTIELTDYEKKQEEEAIISYQELLEAKNRSYNINDDEEIDSFIDELKSFRTNLKGE